MRIEPQYLECTAFLVAPGEDGKAIPQGTAFLVKVPDENEPGSAFEYVATARHCITDQHSPKIAVRINTMGPPTFDVPESYPGYQDVPTRKGDWWLHTDADVAAIELPPPNERGTLPLEYWSIPLAAFVDREYRLRAHKSVLYGEEIAEVSRR